MVGNVILMGILVGLGIFYQVLSLFHEAQKRGYQEMIDVLS